MQIRKEGVAIDGLSRPYKEIQIFKRNFEWKMAMHGHAFYQIIYVTKGTLCVKTEQDTWYVNQGQAHVLPPNYLHELSSKYGYEQLGIDLFCDNDVRDIAPLLKSYIKQPTVVNCQDVLDDIEILMDKCQIGNRIAVARQISILDNIVIKLLEAHTRVGAERFDRRLSCYINAHLSEKISLENIAGEFHISVPQLERLTRKHFNTSVIELRNQRRLANAKVMLMSSNDSVAMIADELGFCDQAHFSRFFKQRCGMSPSEYRGCDLLQM